MPAALILDRLQASMTDMPFNFLSHADPRQLLSYVQYEHPQTIAHTTGCLVSPPAGDENVRYEGRSLCVAYYLPGGQPFYGTLYDVFIRVA